MRKKKMEKLRERRFWAHFHYYARLPEDIDEIPACIKHVRCRTSEIDDYGLSQMVTVVKSIDMLDLDDTEITNEGIMHLTKLENLKELRLKECRQIDNDCLQYLNQITTLELLHLGGTAVTLDGLEKLISLKNLQTLLVSSDDEMEIVKIQLLKIAAALPRCEFIVNHKSVDLSSNETGKIY
ncbi:MAG TPA: hypothetical protein VIQ00_13295 [Chitinophagaceae bacterium]